MSDMSKYKVHERKGRYYVLGPGMEAHEAKSFFFRGDAEKYKVELDDIDAEIEQLQDDDLVEDDEDLDDEQGPAEPEVTIHAGERKK